MLVLFGAKKLPELARGLGQGMNEFKKAREDWDRELHHTGTQPPPSQPLPSVQPEGAPLPSDAPVTSRPRAPQEG